MKIVKKNVYYCDFCKKKSLNSLRKHEKHCTANPDRICRLCGKESIRDIIEKYAGMFVIDFEYEDISQWMILKPRFLKEFTLNDIKNDTRCPTCTLTVFRCAGLTWGYFRNKFEYDYKAELKDWWEVENEHSP